MNKKLTTSAILVAALLFGSMNMIVFAVGNGVNPLGLEIAGKANEVVSGLQTDIEDFITEQQVNMAQTQEERLAILEEKKDELTTAIEDARTERQNLITQLQEGTITEEDFAAEMKALATGIANQAKSMGELGTLLGNIGQGLGEQLRVRAQTLGNEINDAENEIEAEGLAIAEEMTGFNLPIPDGLPGVPEEIPPVEIPEVPEDVIPTDLPDQVPEDVPPTELPELPIEPPVEIPEVPPVPTL